VQLSGSSRATLPDKPLLGSGAVCITGAHGIGKTTLATHVGWDVLKQG
jgi:MoxR-like ATPase